MLPDSENYEEFFLHWLSHFSRKSWENDQNPNTVRNFSPYTIRFLKSSLKEFKNHGGGGGVSRPS